jgi:rRNA processing protein Krr1/Pno1
VEINTPKGDRDNAAPVIITITGTADGVARASRAINDLCSKGYTKLLAGDDFKEGSIEVHPNCLSDIIGKKGLNIRAIQDFTGVKLAVPQVSRDHILPVKITVAGPKEKVQQAKDIILELITYFHTTVTHPGQVHVEMDVPVALYNYIIGSKGSEIKHIQANFKVAVHIPNADSRVKQVLIVGEPVGVKGAEKYIQKIIDQAMADREAAEKMADSWVEEEAVEENEEWMNEFTHPKNRHQDTDNTPSPIKMGGGLSTTGVEYPEGGLNVGAASSAAVAASASSWGANVLASAEGW